MFDALRAPFLAAFARVFFVVAMCAQVAVDGVIRPCVSESGEVDYFEVVYFFASLSHL